MPLATAQRVSELHPHQKKTKGSFDWDQKNGWTREWASFADFEAWLWEEQLTHTIEFTLSSTKMGKWLWTERRTHVCMHQMSGGQKKFEKKYPDWQCKINSKKTDCHCQIESKHYLHTLTILGRYKDKHNHEIQLANVIYIHLSHMARNQINIMLKQKN